MNLLHQAKSSFLRSLSHSYFDFFIVSLLTLLFVLTAYTFLNVIGFKGESLEWTTYIFSGTLLPAMLMLFGLWYQSQKKNISNKTPTLFKESYITFALLFSYTILVSLAAIKIFFWTNIATWIKQDFYKILIFLLFLFLLIAAFFNFFKITLHKKSNLIFNGFAVLILLYFSARSLNLVDIFHGGVFIGPIQMIRNGGYLLWDVPSQYGFLNVLIASILPFKSSLSAMLFLNSLLFFISSLIFYLIFSSKENSLFKKMVILLITICFVFYIPGWFKDLKGAYYFPSVGPMRFVWVYILLALLFFFPSDKEVNKRNKWYLLGNICWVLSIIWSIESAVYTTAIWIPAFYCMISNNCTFKNHSRNIILWLSPILLLGLVLSLISVYYVIRIGHLPDFMSYADYAAAFSNGFGGIPISKNGAIWYLLLLFLVPCFALFKSISQSDYTNKLPLALGCFGGFWVVSSYFISRSHDNNFLNLSPLLLLVIIIITKKFTNNTNKLNSPHYTIFSITIIPILVLCLTYLVSNSDKVINNNLNVNIACDNPSCLYERSNGLNDLLTELYHAKKISPNDPIILLDHEILQNWTNSTPSSAVELTRNPWLPLYPMYLLNPLDNKKIEQYIRRYANQHEQGGWLIHHNIKNLNNFSSNLSTKFIYKVVQENLVTKVANYTSIINKYYTIDKNRIYNNEDWSVIWYDYTK